MSVKKALIIGITGQDGSYLAEFLLKKNYEVHGLIRRASNINTQRIEHLYKDLHEKDVKLFLHYGDLSDGNNINHLIKNILPDEIYNLGAMSHVAVSFDTPEYTANIDGLGTLRILEAIRLFGLEKKVKFYQASTSELYGKVQEIPQTETTPFYPRSPYGVAKLYAYWIVKNYREAYGIFAVNGILHNHETLIGNTPIIYSHDKKVIDIKPISEIVRFNTLSEGFIVDEKFEEYQQGEVERDLFVWDQNGWTKVLFASAYKHDKNDPKNPKFIVSKNSCYMATGSHPIIMEDGSEKEVTNIEINDKVKLTELPKNFVTRTDISDFEAEFLGLIVGDGYINDRNSIRFINKSEILREYITELWKKICNKYQNIFVKPYFFSSRSGFKPENIVGYIEFIQSNWYLKKFQLYNIDKTKRVPDFILNSPKEIKQSFLVGYNKADGLKSNDCIYEFKNFKTNSITLACGLIYLLKETTGQDYNINIDDTLKENGRFFYYSINILSNSKKSHKSSLDKINKVRNMMLNGTSQREMAKISGISRTFISKIQRGYVPDGKHPNEIDKNSVKKIINCDDYNGWFYDLETESGTFCCGPGEGVVHNSPRRGFNFVTKKITQAVANIYKGNQQTLYLGNLESQRDWGHAKDFVEGMWMMLQTEIPNDFVLATGETNSIRKFVELAFKEIDIEIEWKGTGVDEIGIDSKNPDRILVKIDSKYFRPTEVELLIGDYSKAEEKLGWKPKIKLPELIKEMVNFDLKN